MTQHGVQFNGSPLIYERLDKQGREVGIVITAIKFSSGGWLGNLCMGLACSKLTSYNLI